MPGPARLSDLVTVSDAVRDASSRLAKRDLLADYLRALPPEDLRLAAVYLSGDIPQRALHVGWRAVHDIFASQGEEQLGLFEAERGPLTLADCDAALAEISAVSGKGASRSRARILGELFRRGKTEEREFLSRLVLGELRQGALRALVIEALALAYDVPIEDLRRAVMVSGDFGKILTTLADRGASALSGFQVRPFVPVEAMLAASAGDPEEVVEELGEVAVEWKLDGVRVQVHREGDTVRVYTRRLREVTDLLPDLVRVAKGFPVTSCILDGEVIAYDDANRPAPFQDLMGLVSREEKGDRPLRIEPVFFDLLYLDGEPTVDAPYSLRRETLERVLPRRLCIPQIVARSPAEARFAYEAALAAGHEGAVLKKLDAPYVAGRRGSQWRKVKPAHTLDLVILAAEWGSGRRRGFLSNIHLGARDPSRPGTFLMLGKTFKGLTDAMLREMTEDLLSIATHKEDWVVHVKPLRVVEIAFDGIQRSPRYDSGMALRFARVKRFRPDKGPEDASTIEEVRGAVT